MPTREIPRTVEPNKIAILAALDALEIELRTTLRIGAQADRVRAIRNAFVTTCALETRTDSGLFFGDPV